MSRGVSRFHSSHSPVRGWSSFAQHSKRGKLEMDMDFSAPDWKSTELPKFEKKFYQEHPLSASRPEVEVEAFRKKYKMSLSGRDVPRPVLSFNELSVPDYILSVIAKNGWQLPTPIQSQGWPMALSGRDVVGSPKLVQERQRRFCFQLLFTLWHSLVYCATKVQYV
uniref:RNA helicase n=1 Tax=Schistosoma japonicum TaxID=6182 RepID=C1LL25_SCHJA|nr:Furin-1 precursor [Schistosoma japonicum]